MRKLEWKLSFLLSLVLEGGGGEGKNEGTIFVMNFLKEGGKRGVLFSHFRF